MENFVINVFIKWESWINQKIVQFVMYINICNKIGKKWLYNIHITK